VARSWDGRSLVSEVLEVELFHVYCILQILFLTSASRIKKWELRHLVVERVSELRRLGGGMGLGI
jgi:hypothetical protein